MRDGALLRVRRLAPTRLAADVRREVRGAALALSDAIAQQFPGVTVEVDMHSVDGEDAILWIRDGQRVRGDGLAHFVDGVCRRQTRRTGFWIVPRILPGAASPDDRQESFDLASSAYRRLRSVSGIPLRAR